MRVIVQSRRIFSAVNIPYQANTPILPQNIIPQYDFSVIRVLFATDTAGVLYITLDGKDYCLNSCSSIPANALYVFDIPLAQFHTINFKFSVSANITIEISELVIL